MSFVEAVEAMLAGKKVSRELWDSEEEYGLIKDGWIMIHTSKQIATGAFHQWSISDRDYLADDWFIL
jgi:hypothetical protein